MRSKGPHGGSPPRWRGLAAVAGMAATLGLALAIAPDARARVYVWVNVGSGSIEMSGNPPAWYRSGERGPRIQVYERGNLVDDTSIRLTPGHNEEMRQAAFDEFERRRQEEALKKLERTARREQLRQTQDPPQIAGLPGGASEPAADAEGSPESLPENLDEEMIDRLKGLIQAWDQSGAGGAGSVPTQ